MQIVIHRQELALQLQQRIPSFFLFEVDVVYQTDYISTMKNVMLLILVCTSGLVWAGSFPTIETRTIANDQFLFPDQALQDGPALFAIALSESRSNGEVQQQMLLDWHEQLLAFNDMEVFHVSVIQSPPRFVQGIIRRAIGKFYEDTVSGDHAVVLFLDDIESFASQAGFHIDDEPTIVVVDGSGEVMGFVKGEKTKGNISRLQELVSYLNM